MSLNLHILQPIKIIFMTCSCHKQLPFLCVQLSLHSIYNVGFYWKEKINEKEQDLVVAAYRVTIKGDRYIQHAYARAQSHAREQPHRLTLQRGVEDSPFSYHETRFPVREYIQFIGNSILFQHTSEPLTMQRQRLTVDMMLIKHRWGPATKQNSTRQRKSTHVWKTPKMRYNYS